MPTGDNIAAAIAISGASGNTISGNYTNAGAGVESGEPGHHKYNPSPVTPLTNSLVGPFNTIWFVWTCPTSGNYYFSTRNSSPNNAWLTNFPSTCNAFTLLSGTVAANNLLRVTTLMDQTVGDANGTDLGASVAFAATAGTTYYIQVDSRASGATGNVALFWGPYAALTWGDCGSGAINFDSSAQCVGAVQITDLTTNGFYSFGSIPAAPGNYVVVLNYGTAIQALNGSSNPCAAVVDGNAAGFTIWVDSPDNAGSGPVSQPAYAAGAIVCDPGTFNFSVAAIAVPACAPGSPGAAGVYWSMPKGPGSGSQFGTGYSSYDPNTSYNVGDWEGPGSGSINIVCATACPAHGPYGNGCTQNGGIYWNCLGTYNPPASLCAQTIVPHHAVTSPIGIGLIGSASATNGPQNPTYQLIYYPITIGLLTNEQGWNFLINQSWYGGSPTSWTAKFNISNHSSQDWDETTVTLLTGGGISSPSAPQVIDIPPSTYSSPSTSTNEFTFTADQTAGLMTATLQISRNGIVVGNLVYPLYPILTATLATNTQEENCTGPSGGPVIGNSWKNTFTFTILWPPSSTGDAGTGFAGFTENTIAACGDGSGPGTCQLSPTATVVSGPSLMTYEVEEGPYAAICTAVSSISAPQCSGFGNGTMDVWLQAGSTPQAAELQLTFYFQTGPSTIFTLSTVTFNLTVNAA